MWFISVCCDVTGVPATDVTTSDILSNTVCVWMYLHEYPFSFGYMFNLSKENKYPYKSYVPRIAEVEEEE